MSIKKRLIPNCDIRCKCGHMKSDHLVDAGRCLERDRSAPCGCKEFELRPAPMPPQPDSQSTEDRMSTTRDPSTDQPCAYKSDLGKCTLSSGHGSIHLMPGRIKVAVLPKTADPINRPTHYTSSDARCECGNAIECIQVTETMDFCLGNATKYIWRAGLKGDAVEDLKKAAWYIERAIQQRTK